MVERSDGRAFILGCNTNTLAFVSALRGATVEAHLVPLAWTPIGVVAGDAWQSAKIPAASLLAWIDQTFSPDDDHAFIAQVRDVELLLRSEWEAGVPARLDETSLLNLEDVPDEIADALVHPAAPIVQCATCRRLCVRDEFVWKERQLCAWDYHTAVFGKRGPWRNGAYEDRLFETLPTPAYVAPPLLEERNVEVLLATGLLEDSLARSIVNQVLDADPGRSHIAVRSADGYTVLRERTA